MKVYKSMVSVNISFYRLLFGNNRQCFRFYFSTGNDHKTDQKSKRIFKMAEMKKMERGLYW